MTPFPFVFLTWREAIVGVQPTEMCYMQVEKNWVTFNPHGEPQGNGYATGRNMGFVKWRMRDDVRDSRLFRVLRSESFDRKTEEDRVEEVWVDPTTNAIAYQNEERTVGARSWRTECTFLANHVELRCVVWGAPPKVTTMYPAEGMEAVQRRFAPLNRDKAPKDFLVVDGLVGTFHKVHVEVAGHYRGNWGSDRYAGIAYRFDCEGRSQTAMLSEASEVVKVDFGGDVSLALMSQPKSRRCEDRDRDGR